MTYPTEAMVEAGAEAIYVAVNNGHPIVPFGRLERDHKDAYRKQAFACIVCSEQAAWIRPNKDNLVRPKGLFEKVLCHSTKDKWIRFGFYYYELGCWYYSGTSERSQFSQIHDGGSKPTHFRPFPTLPEEGE